MTNQPLSRQRRRIVVEMILNQDTDDQVSALHAFAEALRLYVLEDGEEWKVLSEGPVDA